MINLYLTRHGQTQWNKQKRLQGQSNSPLTNLGQAQAQALGCRMKEIPIDKIYTSTLGRAIQTAEIINQYIHKPIHQRESLSEIYLGPWQGKTKEEIMQTNKEQFDYFWAQPHLFTFDQAETYDQMIERTNQFLDEVKNDCSNQSILVVSHGVTGQVIISQIEGLPLEDIWSGNRMDPTSLSHFIYDENSHEWTTHFKTDISHLKKLQARDHLSNND